MTTAFQEDATSKMSNANYPLIVTLLVIMWFVASIHGQAGILIYVVDCVIVLAASYAIDKKRFQDSKTKHPFFMGATWQGLLFWIISFAVFITINSSITTTY